MNHKARTPAEVFDHHVKALNEANLDDVALDYAEGSIFITKDGILRGPAAIKQWFQDALTGPLVGAQFKATTLLIQEEILYLEWAAQGRTHQATGVDTFVIRDGLVQVQTVKLLSLTAA